VVPKGAGLSDCNARASERRDLRSVEPDKREQSHPGLALTKRPKHPGCPAAGSLRGGPETQAALAEAGGGLGPPDRRYTPAAATWGARALASRRGARIHRERAKRSIKPVPCPSLGGARPMLPGEAIPRAPSLHRGGALAGAPSSPRKRRRPRKGYAERVVRRHGSLASSPHRTRIPVVPVPDGGLPPHQTSGSRVGWKHP